MRIDMGDLVSATDLARQSSWLLKEIAAGRRFVIVKGNTPAGALVSIADLEKLAAVTESEATSSASVRNLPAQVPYADLDPLSYAAPRHALPIGVGEDANTVWLDLEQYPHAYCTGTNRSGRTTFLQAVCAAITARYTPDEAQVVVFDPNCGLIDDLGDEYRTVYQYDPKRIGSAAEQLAVLLDQRRPPADLTQDQLREWDPVRPKWFVIVDDLHLLTGGGSSLSTLLAPLVEAAETARRLDLHIIAAITSDNWNSKGRANRLINAMDVGGATVVVLEGSPREIIIDHVRPGPRLPGRAELYERRGGGRMIQIASAHVIAQEEPSAH